MATTPLYLSPIALILQQVFTNTGIMAQGGQATIFEAGTTTLAETFTDSTGIVANPNPITLNSAGRIASNSGAPVAVWAPSGTVLTVAVVDNQGNQLIYLPFIPGINDPAGTSSLQALLASPASSNASSVGPVAGADLVANAVKSYDVFADVRAANAPVLAAGQTLVCIVEGALTVGDSAGGLFYWSASSTAADDGETVLQPGAATAAGRWLRIVLPQNSVDLNNGTLECTLTDGVNSATCPVLFTIDNDHCTLRVQNTTITSGADTMQLTGLSSALMPTTTLVLPCFLEDDNNLDLLGFASVSSGTITFALCNTNGVSNRVQGSTGAFTSSGTKGLVAWSITYPLN